MCVHYLYYITCSLAQVLPACACVFTIYTIYNAAEHFWRVHTFCLFRPLSNKMNIFGYRYYTIFIFQAQVRGTYWGVAAMGMWGDTNANDHLAVMS